jgi:hypothetical protein
VELDAEKEDLNLSAENARQFGAMHPPQQLNIFLGGDATADEPAPAFGAGDCQPCDWQPVSDQNREPRSMDRLVRMDGLRRLAKEVEFARAVAAIQILLETMQRSGSPECAHFRSVDGS